MHLPWQSTRAVIAQSPIRMICEAFISSSLSSFCRVSNVLGFLLPNFRSAANTSACIFSTWLSPLRAGPSCMEGWSIRDSIDYWIELLALISRLASIDLHATLSSPNVGLLATEWKVLGKYWDIKRDTNRSSFRASFQTRKHYCERANC